MGGCEAFGMPPWVAVQALNPACTCCGTASCQPLLHLCAEYVPEGSDSVVLAQEQITGEELDVDAKVSHNAMPHCCSGSCHLSMVHHGLPV